MKRPSFYIAGLVICAIGAGCSQMSSSGGQEVRLIASSRPYEVDVPIPAMFKLVDKASEDRSTGVSRLYLRHLYIGPDDKYAVRRFYQEHMPLGRWVKSSAGNIQGVCTLRYEKGSESCTIEIRDTPKVWGTGCQIQILISQEQRGSGQSEAQTTIRTK